MGFSYESFSNLDLRSTSWLKESRFWGLLTVLNFVSLRGLVWLSSSLSSWWLFAFVLFESEFLYWLPELLLCCLFLISSSCSISSLARLFLRNLVLSWFTNSDSWAEVKLCYLISDELLAGVWNYYDVLSWLSSLSVSLMILQLLFSDM